MITLIWLLKLVVAHLLSDFVLQPRSWVDSRKVRHFASGKLYLHGLVTGTVALLFIGIQYWLVALIIAVTHLLIDGWKSYQKDNIYYFLADQALHFLILFFCWYFFWGNVDVVSSLLSVLQTNNDFWLLLTGAVLLSSPTGILIGQMTKGWREKILNPETLANAGKWIGIIERMIVYALVLMGEFSAISLLIAAKGIIRFNEKDRPEVKTEYLVIGTLLSIGIAMVVGIFIRNFLG